MRKLVWIAGASAVFALLLSLVAQSQSAKKPAYTYIAGPNKCSTSPLYPDPAICTVPDEKPPGKFKPPAVGGSYVDPNFGAKIRVMSSPTSYHGYSSPTAISPSNKYILLFEGEGPVLVDVATAKKVADLPIPFEGTMWDARDDNYLYFASGTTIQRFDISVKRATALVDYSKAPFGFNKVQTGGQSDTSKDNWIAFIAPNQQKICAFDVNRSNTYCGSFAAADLGGRTIGSANEGGAWMSKGVDSQSNKRYVVLGASPMVFYSVNTNAGKLDLEEVGPEIPNWGGNNNGVCEGKEHCMFGDHIDTMEDAQGIQYLVSPLEMSNSPCEFTFDTFRMNAGAKMTTLVQNGGGRTRVFAMFQCNDPGPNWTDYHVGCAKRAPYCVLSTTYNGFAKQLGPTDPVRRTPHQSEIIVMKGNGDEIRRLAQHRSVPVKGEDAQSYWTTPRACLSNDGSYVVWDSNFGEPNKQRVVLAETGYGKTKKAE